MVALPHLALHSRRDMARGRAGPCRAGTSRRSELALLEHGHGQLEEPLEHQSHLSRRDLVAQQRPGVAPQLVGLLVDGALKPEPLWRQRGHSLGWTRRLSTDLVQPERRFRLRLLMSFLFRNCRLYPLRSG